MLLHKNFLEIGVACHKLIFLLIENPNRAYNIIIITKRISMTRHLNLVQSDFEHLEKRILPRFPFCFLTFKCSADTKHVFEVKDISNSGMQLGLKIDGHALNENENIHGFLHWAGRELEVTGNVKWKTDLRLGVEFSSQASVRQEVDSFLDIAEVARVMKPVHKLDYGIEIPAKLKYWLRADGPVEIFVWQHSDGELARFQILIMENFVEWEDGKGLKTARVISKRDIDTPLITEDEFVFKVDDVLDDTKIERSWLLADNINPDIITAEALSFIKMKLRS